MAYACGGQCGAQYHTREDAIRDWTHDHRLVCGVKMREDFHVPVYTAPQMSTLIADRATVPMAAEDIPIYRVDPARYLQIPNRRAQFVDGYGVSPGVGIYVIADNDRMAGVILQNLFVRLKPKRIAAIRETALAGRFPSRPPAGTATNAVGYMALYTRVPRLDTGPLPRQTPIILGKYMFTTAILATRFAVFSYVGGAFDMNGGKPRLNRMQLPMGWATMGISGLLIHIRRRLTWRNTTPGHRYQLREARDQLSDPNTTWENIIARIFRSNPTTGGSDSLTIIAHHYNPQIPSFAAIPVAEFGPGAHPPAVFPPTMLPPDDDRRAVAKACADTVAIHAFRLLVAHDVWDDDTITELIDPVGSGEHARLFILMSKELRGDDPETRWTRTMGEALERDVATNSCDAARMLSATGQEIDPDAGTINLRASVHVMRGIRVVA